MRCPSLRELPPPPPGRQGWPWTVESPRLERGAGSPPGLCFSIVTPSFNQGPFLEETLRSVLLQGYPEVEYLVYDGGSTDGSVELIRKYAPWLSHWESGRDAGQGDALARGFARARGGVLAWINSDDFYLPGAFARAAAALGAPPSGMLAGDVVHRQEEDGSSRLLRPMGLSLAEMVKYWECRTGLQQPGMFFPRTACLEAGGLDPALHFVMDFDLVIRLLLKGVPLLRIEEPLAVFRVHRASKTVAQEEEMFLELRRISRRYRRQVGSISQLARERYELRRMFFYAGRHIGTGRVAHGFALGLRALAAHPPLAGWVLGAGLLRRMARPVFHAARWAMPNPWKDRALGRWLWRTNAAGGISFRSRNVSPSLAPGVNLFGNLERPSGLGEAARSSARALAAACVPVYRISFNEEELYRPALPMGLLGTPPYAVNLAHVNALQAGYLVRACGPAAFAGRRNIGYWTWEMERFPATWDASFRYFEELWTLSEYSRRAIAERAPVPVVRMPLCVSIEPPAGDPRARWEIPPDRLVCLCMFNMSSTAVRKNPLGAVRAYRAAFQGRADTFLVVKVSQAETDRAAERQLRAQLEGLDHLLIERSLAREETCGLLAACDVCLSLHRAEGFGLILAEAMALGKAVVATGYSGNMDFMHPGNSYPVRYRLVRNDRHAEPFPRGFEWAEPDLDHAVVLLREILAHPEAARARGSRAAEELARDFSPAAVGKLYRRRLEELGLVF